MIRVLMVTNIITPYRQPLFNAWAESGKQAGIELRTAFMARSEPNRRWPADRYPLNHPHTFHGGLDIPIPGRSIRLHANPGIWSDILCHHWDFVIVGGYDHITSAVAGLLPKGRGGRLLWCESNIFGRRPRGGASDRLKRLLLSRYDGYVVPGERAREYVCTLRPAARRQPFLVLPSAVDETKFKTARSWSADRKAEARRRWGIPTNARVLLSVCRLDTNKGVHRALAAIVGRIDRPLTVVIAGEGPFQNEIRSYVRPAGKVQVRLVGYQEQDAVCELQGLSDGFVLASLWDAGPMALVEAATAGLPLLCSDRAGHCPDLVIEGSNGWTFDTTNPDSILAAVTAFAEAGEDQLAAMGARSAKLTDEKFATRRVVEAINDELIRLHQKRKTTR